MYFTTTDGREVCQSDMCTYCNLDTSGEHQKDCPMTKGYRAISAENTKLAENLFPMDIESWPSWD